MPSDEQALLRAVIDAPEDDLPRLAFADWCEEHGDVDRADFIRVQCRLASLSPADPDWADLTEQERDAAAHLQHRLALLGPPGTDGFHFGINLLDEHRAPFHRGFPFFIHCQTTWVEWTPDTIERFATGWQELARASTLRAIDLHQVTAPAFDRITTALEAGQLAGVSVSPGEDEDRVAICRLLARGTAFRRLWLLGLFDTYGAPEVAALANASALGAVRRLTIQGLAAPPADIERLTAARWFRGLRHFRIHLPDPSVAQTTVAGLGELPDLHTLDLPELAPSGTTALSAGRFPNLGRLIYGGSFDQPLDRPSAQALAAGRFPRLAVFEATDRKMNNATFAELLRADWFARLRVLNLRHNAIGDRAVTVLANHPVTRSLHGLGLGDNPFGKAGLAALARPGAFPELINLDLNSGYPRKATEADLTAFLKALRIPGLRLLDLGGWPVGDAGAKALATNSALAGLRRLGLDSCHLGEAGGRALFRSPHLQGLVQLDLSRNRLGDSLDDLDDPEVLPRLSPWWRRWSRS